MEKGKGVLPAQARNGLLETLEKRFQQNRTRHAGVEWEAVKKKILADGAKQSALLAMEETGGEPDVVSFDPETDAYVFMDCSAETPKGRRSLCYDRAALDGRKENKPQNSALDIAREMGVEMLTETQYRALQQLGAFDEKTSSWIKTPDAIRKLGGALFCDRRYDTVFVYHNGAESYYGARGFHAALRV